jgi:hypothetical protein
MNSSNDGPSKPSAKTYNLLYAKSSNGCAFPGCKNPITVDQTLVGNKTMSRFKCSDSGLLHISAPSEPSNLNCRLPFYCFL